MVKSIKPKMLILNGDIIDIWQFSKSYWPEAHMKVVRRILKFVTEGIPVYYLTGNHDEMLRKFTDVSMQGIVATSLLVIALVGASGVGSAVLRQSGIPWGPAAIFTATTVCGMLAGRKFIKTISPGQVQAGFSMVLTLVALRFLFGAAMTLLGKLA